VDSLSGVAHIDHHQERSDRGGGVTVAVVIVLLITIPFYNRFIGNVTLDSSGNYFLFFTVQNISIN